MSGASSSQTVSASRQRTYGLLMPRLLSGQVNLEEN